MSAVMIIFQHMETVTIPKKLTQKGELIVVSRQEYEEALRVKKRLLWEENDTDEAIRIFGREQKAKKLKRASGFSEILGK